MHDYYHQSEYSDAIPTLSLIILIKSMTLLIICIEVESWNIVTELYIHLQMIIPNVSKISLAKI